MIDLEIRTATLGDLSVLLEFEQGVIEAERPFDITLANDPITYYDLKDMILRDDASVVIAEIGGEIVSSGYALIKQARHYLNHNEYAYLGFMFTLPEYRGKGINGRIIEELKDWSYSKGLKEIRLTVYDENNSAISAYEKMGFKKHIIEMRLE
ncbi:GNAT family N-acetyltransferase [Maribacter sp. HTCC2170]|uniref:GNAT family N-acetyltransferase n=1 Tax=Maribacter sp. (strain HTCC2170 / KCCM 42371) TaxID=313603 RepID=UPI00006B1AB0|nr:GNAT family N-acetyltransferase [Maribacter sp. HTCC2170]EAR00717.1 predicted acetyltransferase [Maribacter sp. HTCC2170]